MVSFHAIKENFLISWTYMIVQNVNWTQYYIRVIILEWLLACLNSVLRLNVNGNMYTWYPDIHWWEFLTLNNYETVSQKVTVLDNEATIWWYVFVAHLLTPRIRLNMNRIDYGA